MLKTFILLLVFTTVASAVSNVEKSTGVKFPDSVNGLELAGVGVRKKGPLKVYALGLYTSPSKSPRASLFGLLRSQPKSTLLMQLTFNSVTGPKMASALSSSLSSRFKEKDSIQQLSDIIVYGASKQKKVGKGTIFQFNCTPSKIDVSINNDDCGSTEAEGIGKAFVDIYLDEKGVSKGLKEDLIENWGE
ncbi:hypothetical protein TrLO_g4752 [Triparma laevis f. longispina]|uniref:Chalcone isomerase domain-containing protein n=1 Tax=Triparma laevis f. longispina TaxID=1714387 RepID=A0A9W7FBB2_9STRA|nr:hypothetical protein TrLO_g4752 [Triparma laevis f. longispina]